MYSFVISKNVKWCHLIWPTLYTDPILYVNWWLASCNICLGQSLAGKPSGEN